MIGTVTFMYRRTTKVCWASEIDPKELAQSRLSVRPFGLETWANRPKSIGKWPGWYPLSPCGVIRLKFPSRGPFDHH